MTSTGAFGPSPPGTPRTPAAFHPSHRVVAKRPCRCSTGAGDVDGALIDGARSGTVCHDVPVRGRKHLAHAQRVHRLVVALMARRDLLLVDLTSDGLRRLGLTRGELLESGARSYPQTAAWARALHDHCARVDGLLWISRQRATSRALILFGDRVKVGELALAPGEVRLTLGAGEGPEAVCAAANRAGITLSGLTLSGLT
jgi:hypothetical protein